MSHPFLLDMRPSTLAAIVADTYRGHIHEEAWTMLVLAVGTAEAEEMVEEASPPIWNEQTA